MIEKEIKIVRKFDGQFIPCFSSISFFLFSFQYNSSKKNITEKCNFNLQLLVIVIFISFAKRCDNRLLYYLWVLPNDKYDFNFPKRGPNISLPFAMC